MSVARLPRLTTDELFREKCNNRMMHIDNRTIKEIITDRYIENRIPGHNTPPVTHCDLRVDGTFRGDKKDKIMDSSLH